MSCSCLHKKSPTLQAALHHLFLFSVHNTCSASFSSLLQALRLVSNFWITASAAQCICPLCWVRSSRFWNPRAIWSLNSVYSGAYLLHIGMKMQYQNIQLEMCVTYSRRSSEGKTRGRSLLARKSTLLSVLTLPIPHQVLQNCFVF